MLISNQNSPSFQAKFLNSDALKQVADYAVAHGNFGKLNQARKNIDNSHLQTRLLLDITQDSAGKPTVSFTRFVPKKTVIIPQSIDDYSEGKTTFFTSNKKVNPLKFALEKIIKLGNNAPNNNMYKNIVKG